MNALLVRVAADRSEGGGVWNGPVDSLTGEFAYVAIPEQSPVHPGLAKPYSALAPVLERFGVRLPAHLARRPMHLDPDFNHLTYGDHRQRAKQLRAHLAPEDLIVFYAGLKTSALGKNDPPLLVRTDPPMIPGARQALAPHFPLRP